MESHFLLESSLNYYMREKLYGKAKEIYDELKSKDEKIDDHPQLSLYNGLIDLNNGNVLVAGHIFESLQQYPDFSYASLAAQWHMHKTVSQTDKSSIQDVESRLRSARKEATAVSSFHAAIVFLYTGNYEKAKDSADKILKSAEKRLDHLLLVFWIESEIGAKDSKFMGQLIDDAKALSNNPADVNIILARSKFESLRQNYQLSIDILNQGSSEFPNFLPFYIEKVKAHFVLKQWEQCAEVAERCLVIDQCCAQASIYLALHATCYEGHYNEAITLLTELLEVVNKVENQNANLYFQISKVFSRICGRNEAVLQICKNFIEKAVEISNRKNSSFLAELAYQYRLSSQYKQSIKFYKQAMEQEDASYDALLGLVHTQILDDNIPEAESQLQLLKSVHQVDVSDRKIMYIESLIAKSKNDPDIKSKLINLAKSQMEKVRDEPATFELFLILDVDFLLEIVLNLFNFAPIEPAKNAAVADPFLKEIITILSNILNFVPGLVEALYLVGKARYLSADHDSALTSLQQCLSKDQTYLEAHILMAQIYLHKQQYKLASQCLELGLSYNFEVREHPIYNLIKARILKKSNKIAESVQLLEKTMNLPKVKNEMGFRKSSSKLELSEMDKVSIYLELIDSYQALDRMDDAAKLMKQALTEYKGKNEEQHLIILNADLALNRGDVERALAMLKGITPDQPNYLDARQKMADIYLHFKKDKREFAACFKEIVEKNPSPQAFVMLGDAYMSIQEPEKAIELYESALKKNPKDHALSSKIGKALVKSHNYAKAVSYYEAALKTGHMNFLRYELADLTLKLGNFDKCERILKQGLENIPKTNPDLENASNDVKFKMLLSKLYFETGNWEGAINFLLQAKENQNKILKRGPHELADKLLPMKTLAAEICCQLGQFYENHRDLKKSISFYQEALNELPQDLKIMLSVARLHLLMGDLEHCYQMCQKVIILDKDNDTATLMLADLMYQKSQTDDALLHFQQLLDRNPNEYHALARAIELAWRCGDIPRAENYLEQASESSMRSHLDAGFNYCKGLIDWYTGDPNSALQHFNRARRDLEWGERSIYNMIEICLNPDMEIIGGEVFDSGDPADITTNNDRQDAKGVETAEQFLKELRFKPGLDYKYRLMENFILMSTKNKQNIENALNNLLQMDGQTGNNENSDVSNVGAILGIARAHMMLKQTPKAKAQLKKVLGRSWSFEEADYLEQCWLLLADLYINQLKYDVATELLQTCLKHNASCVKAMEFLGYIREQEQKWVDAAAYYEKAWLLTKMRNLKIGYKLAFNQLKSRRYIDAIDICHTVLKQRPNYPNIKRDVLDKARANLRT